MKRNKKFSFACLAFCLTILSVCIKAEEPVFKSFDIRSENSRPRIIKLFLDHTGSIWCGTDKGVFVFDGINFTKIIGSDSISSAVSALFEDNTSLLWVGFENGKII